MSFASQQIAEMVDMLPQDEQQLAYQLIKRMVLAWDPDFTKLTPSERERLLQADKEIEHGETVSHEAIDWN